MGGKSSNVNYSDLAEAQGDENRDVIRDQTYANRPTEYTPWGYTNWTTETLPNGTEQWTSTTGLTPELQSILDQEVSILGDRTDIAGSLTDRLGEEFGAPIDFDNVTPLAETPIAQYTLPESYEGIAEIGDPERLRQEAEDAYYGKATSRLDPEYDSKRQNLEIAMRNQGLNPEDAAWQSQIGSLGMQETDAYGQAQYDATIAGMAEADQLFGQDLDIRQQGVGEANDQFSQSLASNEQNYDQTLDSANYANTLRQQELTELMQERGWSLNEINALLEGGQVGMPQMPAFSNASSATAAPVYQAGVDQGNADAASDLTSGLLGLGGTLGGAYLGTL